jgi:hypothetical protein
MRSAKVAYDDAYGDVYNDLKHGVLLGWLCVYIIYGDRSRGNKINSLVSGVVVDLPSRM